MVNRLPSKQCFGPLGPLWRASTKVVHSMLALQRATSESALARAGLGLLRSLAASNCQQAASLHYSYPSAYAESQPGPPPTDLSPELAQTISDAIASTQPEYWPRLSQHKLAAPSVSKATQEQKTRTFELQQAVQLLLGKKKRFDETVEVRYALGTDPRRGDQAVRGAATLPHSTGRRTRLCVFADGPDAEAARKAGAEIVGSDELIDDIQAKGSGAADFDTCLAVRSIMPRLARLGRILGPRGLMPNPKMGTIVEAGGMGEAVQRAKAGRVQYKAGRSAVVHAAVAKLSHTEPQIVANICALTQALLQVRPKGMKGTGMSGYMLGLHVSSTQGPGYAVSLPSVLQTMQARS